MKHLNQWAKGEPLGLVMPAQRLAISAEECFEYLKLIKSGEKIEALLSILKAEESLRIKKCPNTSRTQGFENDNEVFSSLPRTLEGSSSKS